MVDATGSAAGLDLAIACTRRAGRSSSRARPPPARAPRRRTSPRWWCRRSPSWIALRQLRSRPARARERQRRRDAAHRRPGAPPRRRAGPGDVRAARDAQGAHRRLVGAAPGRPCVGPGSRDSASLEPASSPRLRLEFPRRPVDPRCSCDERTRPRRRGRGPARRAGRRAPQGRALGRAKPRDARARQGRDWGHRPPPRHRAHARAARPRRAGARPLRRARGARQRPPRRSPPRTRQARSRPRTTPGERGRGRPRARLAPARPVEPPGHPPHPWSAPPLLLLPRAQEKTGTSGRACSSSRTTPSTSG